MLGVLVWSWINLQLRKVCKPDKVFKGTAYMARNKDPKDVTTIHRKQDFLHAVAYVDLVEGNTNQYIFYTFTINLYVETVLSMHPNTVWMHWPCISQ